MYTIVQHFNLDKPGKVFERGPKNQLPTELFFCRTSSASKAYFAVVTHVPRNRVLLLRSGINQWDGSQPPKYVNNTHLSARVGKLNPDWNEDQSGEATDRRFAEAMALTGAEFEEAVTWISKASIHCEMMSFDLNLCAV